MSGKGLPLDDNDGDGRRFAVRQGDERAHAPELFEALTGWTMQAKFGCTVAPCENLDVAPSNAARELVPGERLVRCLLRGQADR
jgi:hypothetical protein